MHTGEKWYDCLPIDKKGYLNICIECTKGVEKEAKKPDLKGTSILKIQFEDFDQVFKGGSKVQCKLNSTLCKDIESNVFEYDSVVSPKEQAILIAAKPSENITVECISRDKEKTIGTFKIPVPDLKDEEEVFMMLPVTKFINVGVRVTCLRGIYHNVPVEECPKETDLFEGQQKDICDL